MTEELSAALTERDPVANEERIWRRIRPGLMKQQPDGKWRPSSEAFSSHAVSVYRALFTTLAEVLVGYERNVVAEIEARVPRDCRCEVVPDPQPTGPRGHALITPAAGPRPGDPPPRDIPRSCARRMAGEALILRPDSGGPVTRS